MDLIYLNGMSQREKNCPIFKIIGVKLKQNKNTWTKLRRR